MIRINYADGGVVVVQGRRGKNKLVPLVLNGTSSIGEDEARCRSMKADAIYRMTMRPGNFPLFGSVVQDQLARLALACINSYNAQCAHITGYLAPELSWFNRIASEPAAFNPTYAANAEAMAAQRPGAWGFFVRDVRNSAEQAVGELTSEAADTARAAGIAIVAGGLLVLGIMKCVETGDVSILQRIQAVVR